jgi:hypothetical protein
MRDAEVNDLLNLLRTRLEETLGEQFVGLYLYGSLASGDFNPASSDIDFVAVTRDALAPETTAALEAMHQKVWAGGSKWATKLEGSYIPAADLRQYDPAGGPFPQVNEKRFFVSGHGRDWVIQRYILREYGTAVAGPPLKPLIDPVSPDQLRDAARGVLNEWWADMVGNPAWLERREYQAFAALTMCRARYMIQRGAVISKLDAATWAVENLDGRWRPLIERASQWPAPPQPDELAETVAFIRETVAGEGTKG